MSPPAALASSPLGTARHSLFPQRCVYCILPGHLSALRQDHPPTRMQGWELLGCWWPVAVGIRKHPPAHPSMWPQYRDRAGHGGCAHAAAGWVSSWHQPWLPPQHPTSVSRLVSVGQKGPGQVWQHCGCPAPVRGAACPACAGSWCSSPPAHPSQPLRALQPPGLRAEGGRFLSRWRISLLGSSELSPARRTRSICLSTRLLARLQAWHLPSVLGAPGSHCRVLPVHAMSSLGSLCPCSFTGCRSPAGLKCV